MEHKSRRELTTRIGKIEHNLDKLQSSVDELKQIVAKSLGANDYNGT